MEHKYWNTVIGIMLAFTACHATAETNNTESITTTNGTDSAAVASTNETASVAATHDPMEEVQDAPKKRDKFDLIIGGGLVFSSGYGDYLDDVYSPANGYINLDDFAGWVDLYLGVEYRPAEQFGIIVSGDIWLNGGVDASGGGSLDETYANAIFIPSLYGQFYFTKSRTFYINGGINFPIPETGSDFFEFESDGIGFGVNIGVEIADLLRIEGGYVSVPVKVKATTAASLALFPGEESYDFGGAQIRLLLAF